MVSAKSCTAFWTLLTVISRRLSRTSRPRVRVPRSMSHLVTATPVQGQGLGPAVAGDHVHGARPTG